VYLDSGGIVRVRLEEGSIKSGRLREEEPAEAYKASSG
jgi:hypothetical protein